MWWEWVLLYKEGLQFAYDQTVFCLSWISSYDFGMYLIIWLYSLTIRLFIFDVFITDTDRQLAALMLLIFPINRTHMHWIWINIELSQRLLRINGFNGFKHQLIPGNSNKGRFCNNSNIDTLISRRLSVENNAKLSQLTRADFVTMAILTH